MSAEATPSPMMSRKPCAAAMVWRAAHQGLNETWVSIGSAPSLSVSADALGAMPYTLAKKPDSSSLRSDVRPDRAASAAVRPLRAALPIASQRAVQRDIIAHIRTVDTVTPSHSLAPCDQGPALRGAGSGDPRADRIDDVQLQRILHRARHVLRSELREEGGELLEGGHLSLRAL